MNEGENLAAWQPCRGYCQMTGAASALLCLGDSRVILNAPRWCAVLAERELLKGCYGFRQRLFCSEVLQNDLIYGSADKLKETLEEAWTPDTSLLTVLSSCAISLIGDDTEGICRAALATDRVRALDAGGLGGEYWSGWIRGTLLMLEHFLGHCKGEERRAEGFFPGPSSSGVKRPVVNLIGFSVCEPGAEGGRKELERLLGMAGIDVNVSLLHPGLEVEDFRSIPEACLNIVINTEFGLEVAQWLEENCGMPYLEAPFPVGPSMTEKWLRAITVKLGIDGPGKLFIQELDLLRKECMAAVNRAGGSKALSFGDIMVSAGETGVASFTQGLRHDFRFYDRMVVRVQSPGDGIPKERDISGWNSAMLSPGVNGTSEPSDQDFRILFGTLRDRLEVEGFRQTVYLNVSAPRDPLQDPDFTYMGLRGWRQLMHDILSQFSLLSRYG